MVKRILVGMTAAGAAWLLSCTSHHVQVDPIEVKPITMTVDINLKIQRELEDFFDFEKGIEEKKSEGEKPERQGEGS